VRDTAEYRPTIATESVGEDPVKYWQFTSWTRYQRLKSARTEEKRSKRKEGTSKLFSDLEDERRREMIHRVANKQKPTGEKSPQSKGGAK
jgi:hypothetical protein